MYPNDLTGRSFSLHVLAVLITLLSLPAHAMEVERIDPPFWWTGMKDPAVQLMVFGQEVGMTTPFVNADDIEITGIHRVDHPDYLFIDLLLGNGIKAGTFTIEFRVEDRTVAEAEYRLLSREEGSHKREGFDASDVIYLLMPDRFANGDPANDSHPEMLEKADRQNPDGRHGGDIQGIIDHLGYLQGLGIGAVWINPLLENNNPEYSYHGYAITDFYRVDPRFGSNEDYLQLIDICHDKGIKVIMDMVFNHCSVHNLIIKELPDSAWIHTFETFTKSNFRGSAVMDPYASEQDRKIFLEGWFDNHMADLNQENPLVARYLIQNTIWWLEYSGIDGIRVDTQPYSDPGFISEWAAAVLNEYPAINIVGEAWLQKESFTAWFQDGFDPEGGFDSNVPVVTDFPLYYAITKAFHEKEGWTEGVARLYYVLAQDFIFPHPHQKLIFCDNHDLNRYYTSMGEDPAKYFMGLAFLLTTRGIPMIYYGTEIMMTGKEHKGHGFIRQDFPGGWPGDTINAFSRMGRTELQNQAFDFLRTLIRWRNENPGLISGKLTHFIPEDNVYVYFRDGGEKSAMVVLNNNPEEKLLNTERFTECLKGYASGRDVLHDRLIDISGTVRIGEMSALILELSRDE